MTRISKSSIICLFLIFSFLILVTPCMAEELPETRTETEEAVPISFSRNGNLTLVDDFLLEAGDGSKQFVSLSTRSGEVFYLIIDRSAETENVYFLNEVDESDLLPLISEKAVLESYEKEKAAKVASLSSNSSDSGTILPTEDTRVPALPAWSYSLLLILPMGIIIGILLKKKKALEERQKKASYYDEEDYEPGTPSRRCRL